MDCLRPIEAALSTGNGAAPRPPAIQGNSVTAPTWHNWTGARWRDPLFLKRNSAAITLHCSAHDRSGESRPAIHGEACMRFFSEFAQLRD